MITLLISLILISAPPTSQQAEPVRISVTVSGEGPDVVLVPGLASPGATWDATVAYLKGRYRIHVVEVSGFAGRPAGPNATGEVNGPVVEELAVYFEKNGLVEPSVIGHSLGGLLTLMLAARHPTRVGKALIVDGQPMSAYEDYPDKARDEVTALMAIERDRNAAISPADFANRQKQILASLIKDPTCYARLTPLIGKSDPRVVAQSVFDAQTTDVRPALAKTKVPIFVVYAHDINTPGYEGQPPDESDKHFAKAYREVPVVNMMRIDGSYHFIMCDQQKRFHEIVAKFLSFKG